MSYGYTEDCSAGRDAQGEVRGLRYDVNDLQQEIRAARRDTDDEAASRRAAIDELWNYVHELQREVSVLQGEVAALQPAQYGPTAGSAR